MYVHIFYTLQGRTKNNRAVATVCHGTVVGNLTRADRFHSVVMLLLSNKFVMNSALKNPPHVNRGAMLPLYKFDYR